MTVLREEDRQALQCLGATPVHLPFLDVEYGTTYEIEEIADAIAAQLDALGPESVLIPLGIQHLDHVTTHRAVVRLIRERPQIRWIIYEELPYRLEYAEYRQTQVRELLEGGFRLSELALPRNLSTRPKLRAIHKYESQCKAMGRKRIRLALLDERYWEVSVVGDTEAVGP